MFFNRRSARRYRALRTYTSTHTIHRHLFVGPEYGCLSTWAGRQAGRQTGSQSWRECREESESNSINPFQSDESEF